MLLHTYVVIQACNATCMGIHELYAHDSHYLLFVILDYPHKNLYFMHVIFIEHASWLSLNIKLLLSCTVHTVLPQIMASLI